MPHPARRLPPLLLLALLPALASCGGDDGVSPLPAPAGLTATWDGALAQLAWAPVSGADAYRVERAAEDDGFETIAARVAGTTHADVLPPGSLYRYRVRALRGGSESAPSNEAVVDLGLATLDQLFFVRFADDAPPLSADSVSFWAVAGDGREVEIDYVLANGERMDCLEFRVPGNALRARPDGTPFAEGDSVRITIRVVDASRFQFEFSPSGLRFDPEHPAELRISYDYADPDFNGDGEVDDEDRDFEFALWKQESPALPWVRVGTAVFKDLEEVRADLDGFTGYILAGGSRRFR